LTLAVLFIIALLWVNRMLYYEPETIVIDGEEINGDVLNQLTFLQKVIDGGADEEMQKIYPEGYVFINALYGLTWFDIAQNLPTYSPLYAQAHDEIDKSCKKLLAHRAKATFDESLPLPYGAFYNGWASYLLGKKLALERPDLRNEDEINIFKAHCAGIAAELSANASPYPASYSGSYWPADAILGVASLVIHDKLFETTFDGTVTAWLDKVKNNLDSIGLIPHSTHDNGQPLEAARGSSQSLMLCFLNEIDTAFARQQFELYKKHFISFRMGLPVIREYPLQVSGPGDIDSGPVVFQAGAAATIVGIRTMSLYREFSLAAGLRNGVEAFGAPVSLKAEKKYLLGQFVMADAFIAWANVHRPDGGQFQSIETRWRTTFQLYSLAIVSLLTYSCYGLVRIQRRTSRE
jgi:hypothetical protein